MPAYIMHALPPALRRDLSLALLGSLQHLHTLSLDSESMFFDKVRSAPLRRREQPKPLPPTTFRSGNPATYYVSNLARSAASTTQSSAPSTLPYVQHHPLLAATADFFFAGGAGGY